MGKQMVVTTLAERGCEPDPFDLVGMRETPGAFMAKMRANLGNGDRLLEGTRLDPAQDVPEKITVRDYLTMVGNLTKYGPDASYYIGLAQSGVPLYYGGLDLGMRFGPDLRSVLKLVAAHADDRPGYFAHVLIEQADRLVLDHVTMTDLGDARQVVTATPMLFYQRSAARCLGRVAHEAVVELRHKAPSYADKLQAALGCQINFEASRDAISYPLAMVDEPSVSFDPALWQAAKERCKEEREARSGDQFIATIRKKIVDQLLTEQKLPRRKIVAQLMGISTRTVVRRLQAQGTSYQDLLDDILRQRSVALLAQEGRTIADIASSLGFGDPSSFFRSYKRWFGMTPRQHQELISRM